MQELQTGFGKDARDAQIGAGLADQAVHRGVQVVVLVGGHLQVMVQLQVAGEGPHHPAGKGIDGADRHVAPVVQHVAQHGIGPLFDDGPSLPAAPLQMLQHIPHGAIVHIPRGELSQVAHHAGLHLAGRLVREGQGQHLPVGTRIIAAEAMGEVVLDQGVGLARTGGTVKDLEHRPDQDRI